MKLKLLLLALLVPFLLPPAGKGQYGHSHEIDEHIGKSIKLMPILAAYSGPETLSSLDLVPDTSLAQSPAAQAPNACGDNYYSNYIYTHESGCDVNAVNYLGCRGIGQDCDGIMWPRCGTSYQCQNEYFTSYVNGRYGGWQDAYSFWISHHWY